jgi:hypothetical protein
VRVGMALLWAVLAAGCSLPPSRPTVVWGDRVPDPAPEAIANQPVVARGPNTVTLLPVSPGGAEVSVAYRYDMPHCGVNGPIDIDGSFWDAVGIAPDSVDFDGARGTFRLVSDAEAVFTTSDGRVLHLVRHAGAKEFRLCA